MRLARYEIDPFLRFRSCSLHFVSEFELIYFSLWSDIKTFETSLPSKMELIVSPVNIANLSGVHISVIIVSCDLSD